MILAQASTNGLALGLFAVILAVTLGITAWASKRTSTATDFWTAGRSITGLQNGLAITGDNLSAAAFLGLTGLIFLNGFDGWIVAIASTVALLPVLLFLAERMRNAGKFTMADVLAYRLRQKPTRAAAAVATLCVAGFYLMAQLVGAGVLIQVLTGLDFSLSVLLTGSAMLVYVVFGGMLATTWVQIVKACLLLGTGALLTILVLGRVGFNPIELFNRAAAEHPQGFAYLGPGLSETSPLGTVSLALTFVIGFGGLPHILMRFFTVPDARAARSSVAWAIVFIGAFLMVVSIIGFGARALLGRDAEEAVGGGGNLAGPLLAQELGGGAGSLGGDLFLAFIAAVAIATILAVVAGLVISASGAIAHDIWSNIFRPGGDAEREEPIVAKIAAAGVGAVAIGLTILAGPDFNITFLVGLAFSVAASANFPTLLLALTWRRFTTTGAVAGIALGLLSSLVLIALSPSLWPGPNPPFPLAFPVLISVPLGFLGCWLGSVLGPEDAEERSFDDMLVRAETGIGSEPAGGAQPSDPSLAKR